MKKASVVGFMRTTKKQKVNFGLCFTSKVNQRVCLNECLSLNDKCSPYSSLHSLPANIKKVKLSLRDSSDALYSQSHTISR